MFFRWYIFYVARLVGTMYLAGSVYLSEIFGIPVSQGAQRRYGTCHTMQAGPELAHSALPFLRSVDLCKKMQQRGLIPLP